MISIVVISAAVDTCDVIILENDSESVLYSRILKDKTNVVTADEYVTDVICVVTIVVGLKIAIVTVHV